MKLLCLTLFSCLLILGADFPFPALAQRHKIEAVVYSVFETNSIVNKTYRVTLEHHFKDCTCAYCNGRAFVKTTSIKEVLYIEAVGYTNVLRTTQLWSTNETILVE